MVSTFSTISYRVQSPLPVPSPFIFVTLCYSPNEIPNFRERADSYHMEQPTSQAPWLILPWLFNFLWRSLTSKIVAKSELTLKKSDVRVCVCIVGLQELFIVSCCCPPGQTIDSNLYCQQLKRLRKAIEIKRPELINRKGVIFHHNNARHHTSLVTRQKLRAWLGSFDAFTVYSPDLAPSNYHLSAGFKRDL
ncbi:hypothetical protein HZH68_002558 [Vespula germanica]|uniref:Histone-lysine N-methyltransferase SETMAR n=1 Tax=Vespula germanica TaxID=30212 RepID=A0A834NMI3_VESGE|nr:hypothetical protein HZH68_002558 [Vespula germanica]